MGMAERRKRRNTNLVEQIAIRLCHRERERERERERVLWYMIESVTLCV